MDLLKKDNGLVYFSRLYHIEQSNYNVFLGSEKNTWGYKTTGEILHNNCCAGNVIKCTSKKNRFVYDELKHEFRLYLDDDNQIILFDNLPSKGSIAVSLLNPDSSVFSFIHSLNYRFKSFIFLSLFIINNLFGLINNLLFKYLVKKNSLLIYFHF